MMKTQEALAMIEVHVNKELVLHHEYQGAQN